MNYILRAIISLLLLSFGMILLSFEDDYNVKYLQTIATVTGIGCLLVCFYSLYLTFKYMVSGSPLIRQLTTEAKQFVWVYHYIVENKPYGIQILRMTTVYFNMSSGEQIGLLLPLKKAEKLLQLLRTRLPHATFGHSGNKEFLYKTDPMLLFIQDDDITSH